MFANGHPTQEGIFAIDLLSRIYYIPAPFKGFSRKDLATHAKNKEMSKGYMGPAKPLTIEWLTYSTKKEGSN